MKSRAYLLTICLIGTLFIASCRNVNSKSNDKNTEAQSDSVSVVELTASDIYNSAKNSVVMIMAYDNNHLPISQGSGFFVDSTLIVTNNHVIEGASFVEYKMIGVDEFFKDARIEGASELYDLATIRTNSTHTKIDVDTTCSNSIGEKVFVLSNPRGLEGTISEGIISAFRDENYKLIQTTAPISPGSSGSPLINKDGKVIGVSTFTFIDSQNLNFAVPLNYLSQCKPYVVKIKKQEKKAALLKNDAVQVGQLIVATEYDPCYALISFRNNTSNTITYLYGIMIFYDRNGEPYDYMEYWNNVEIYPHLTKQLRYSVGDDRIHPGQYIGVSTKWNYKKSDSSRDGSFLFTLSGSTDGYGPNIAKRIEVRILYYEYE